MIFFYHIFKQKIILKNKAVKPSGVHDPGWGFGGLIKTWSLGQSNMSSSNIRKIK